MEPILLSQTKFTRAQADNIAYGIRALFPSVYCTTIIHPLLGPLYRIAANDSTHRKAA